MLLVFTSCEVLGGGHLSLWLLTGRHGWLNDFPECVYSIRLQTGHAAPGCLPFVLFVLGCVIVVLAAVKLVAFGLRLLTVSVHCSSWLIFTNSGSYITIAVITQRWSHRLMFDGMVVSRSWLLQRHRIVITFNHRFGGFKSPIGQRENEGRGTIDDFFSLNWVLD